MGTGSLGLVTTLALLLIWRDRVDRQAGRWNRAEVTRLSVQTFTPQAAAVEAKVEHRAQESLSRVPPHRERFSISSAVEEAHQINFL